MFVSTLESVERSPLPSRPLPRQTALALRIIENSPLSNASVRHPGNVSFSLNWSVGFQSPAWLNLLSGYTLRLISWETLESDFHKRQSEQHGELDDILMFVEAAQFKSISRAARSLGMPISP